jgi:hypothetical protein
MVRAVHRICGRAEKALDIQPEMVDHKKFMGCQIKIA